MDSSDDDKVDHWCDPINRKSSGMLRDEELELEDAYTFGRVCEGGHLLLASVSIEGVKEEWAGACVPGTGNKPAVEAFPLVRWLYNLDVGERSIKRGFKAVANLVENDLFTVASRAVALAQSWSRVKEAKAVPTRSSVVETVELMKRSAPDGTRESPQNFLKYGQPSLNECIAILLEEDKIRWRR